MHEARLLFALPDEIANAVHRALSPESGAQVPKTTASLERRAGELLVHLVAEDLSALRAAVNSYARWVDAAERAARVAGQRS